ncbi:MAG: YlbD family protein [Bacillus sp. (in: Bacteria)]|nr:YlbD family protein [Bacillus sp. (in: firmicutes)]
MSKSLHPDVKKFKVFVKNNPYVLKPVKRGDKTLQDLFEEYLLFGEEDDIWETYKSGKATDEEEDVEEEEEKDEKEKGNKSSKKESTGTQDILNMLKKVNFNDLQEHLTQFGGVLASVQELLGQFKQNPQQPPQNNQQQNNSPFSFHDD